MSDQAETLKKDLEAALAEGIDTSDIPEQGEEFFKRAQLTNFTAGERKVAEAVGATPMNLRSAMAAAAAEDKGRNTIPMKPVSRPKTIIEQVQQLETIEREIDNRIRREGVEAQCEVERKVTEAHADFARQLAEQTARLERERDDMVRQAQDAYHNKLHELAELVRRRR